jgi:hypothetical protein
MKKVLAFVLGIALTACAATPPKAAGTPGADRGPVVVFDSPADGTVARMDAVVIQAHADDPIGVARGEISANNQILDIVESPGHGLKNAEVITYSWQPRAPGEYQIGIRAQNSVGTWGSAVFLRVVISEPTALPKAATPTEIIASPTVTAMVATDTTPTPTPSLTPTLTPTITVAPVVPYTDPDTFGVSMWSSFTALHFYPANSNCYPNDSGMTVSVSDMTNVAYVFAFFTMTDTGVYHFPAHHWTDGLIMWQSAPGSNYFWRQITSKSIIADVPYYPNYVLYQFVAINRMGTIVARSPIYRDMSIVQCKK